MKRSLADELKDLSNPTTDFDIEDDNFNVSGSEDESGSSSDEEQKTEHYVGVNKSKLRKDGPKNVYGGQKASRADIYNDEGNSVSESDGDDSEVDSAIESNEDDMEDQAQEEQNDSDSGVSLDGSSSDSESDSEDKEETGDQGNSEDEHKRNKLKAFITKEKQTIGKRIAQSNINDALKGYTVTQQNKLFDQLIESRIKLQKSLTNANMLPKDKASSKPFVTKETSDNVKTVESKCYDLLDTIMKFRNQAYAKESIDTVALPKKRKFSSYANASKEFDDRLRKYRSVTLNKWSNKVSNSSGSNALNASKFKVVNQTAEQQVVNNLNDLERLKKRTYLNRSNIKPLGYDPNEEQDNEIEQVDDEADVNPDIPKATMDRNKNEITQIYDDEDFYRILLNDLVDKKISSNNPTSGVTLSLRQTQKAQKNNKNVDTRASKGRKLKFNIQDPISHFKTPLSLKWDDYQIDEFFASLLGQKINMNEMEETHLDDENNENESELITDSSVKLFS